MMDGRNASYPGCPPARNNPGNMNVSHGMGIAPASHPGGVPMMNIPPVNRSPPPNLNSSAPLVLNNPGGIVGQQPQFQAPLPSHSLPPGQQPMMGGDIGIQPQPVQQHQQPLQFTTAPLPQQPQLIPAPPGPDPPVVGYPLQRQLRPNVSLPNEGFVGQPAGPPPHIQMSGQTSSIGVGSNPPPVSIQQQQQQQSLQQNIPANKQRVFTGAVTKMLDHFGFVDDDVFFQFDVVKGLKPKVGEKVLVEASFNPNMPFKWNANRIQVLPNQPSKPSSRNEVVEAPFDHAHPPQPPIPQQPQQPQPAPPFSQPLPQQQPPPPSQFTGPTLSGGLLPPVVAQPPIVSHQVMDNQQLHQQQLQPNPTHISAAIPPHNWMPNPSAPAPLMQLETMPVVPKEPPPKDQAAKPVLPPRLRVGARGVLTPTTADRKRAQDRDSSEESSESSRRGGSRQENSVSRDSSPGDDATTEKGKETGGGKEKEVEERKIRTRASRQLGRPPPRYYVRIPKLSTITQSADLVALRSRYPNLYIPSDFFVAHLACNSAFDVQHPFPLVLSNPPLPFHVLSKEDCCRLKGGAEASPPMAASIDPPDATRKFVAKVMLLSFPAFKEFCRKSIDASAMPPSWEAAGDEMEEEDLVHPNKCFEFLVGSKGRSEMMAIGGSWSEKHDGQNPDSDPKVLINTAIRTTKALTGIDLSSCTRWYKFLEIHYFRPEEVVASSSGTKLIPARTETVVMFLPDVWNWTLDDKTWDAKKETWKTSKAVVAIEEVAEKPKETEAAKKEEVKPALDPKKMKVDELRAELKRRGISDQGLKSQLIARLHKSLKADLEKYAKETEALVFSLPESTPEPKEATIPPPPKENESPAEEPLPHFFDKPKILAYPNRAAKAGKFDCCVRSLDALLRYRSEDLKESLFEVSLFAELFHERIMRDQGFKIFQSISSISDEKAAAQREREKEYQRLRGEPKAKKKKTESSDRASKERGEEGEEGEKEDEESEFAVKKAPKIPDAHLVFAFTYFDVNRCGYLEQKDLEDLFSILGLHLSRNQMRRILSRVTTRDYISYTKTCFLEAAGLDSEEALISHERTQWPEDKIGNRTRLDYLKLLPIHAAAKLGRKGEVVSTESTEGRTRDGSSAVSKAAVDSGSSVVTYRGQPLDLDKLFAEISKSEAGRLSFRDKLKSLSQVLGATKDDESQLLKDETDNNNKIACLRQEIRAAKRETDDVKCKVAVFQEALKVQQKALETNVDEMTKIIDEEKSKSKDEANTGDELVVNGQKNNRESSSN